MRPSPAPAIARSLASCGSPELRRSALCCSSMLLLTLTFPAGCRAWKPSHSTHAAGAVPLPPNITPHPVRRNHTHRAAIQAISKIASMTPARLAHPGCCARSVFVAPLLRRVGEQPGWDRYLQAVYGTTVQYPVDLRLFDWFFRDNCTFLSPDCSLIKRCTPVRSYGRGSRYRKMTMLWSSDIPIDVIPQQTKRRPASCPRGVAYASSSPYPALPEQLARSQLWPRSETLYPAFGFAVLSSYGVSARRKRASRSIGNFSWIEVFRVPDEYDAFADAVWFNIWGGTGVWINVGKSCSSIPASAQSQECDSGYAIFQPRDRNRIPRCPEIHLAAWARTAGCHTVIRNGIELIDVRRGPTQDPLSSCASLRYLRGGWNASAPCRCDATIGHVNCFDATSPGPAAESAPISSTPSASSSVTLPASTTALLPHKFLRPVKDPTSSGLLNHSTTYTNVLVRPKVPAEQASVS